MTEELHGSSDLHVNQQAVHASSLPWGRLGGNFHLDNFGSALLPWLGEEDLIRPEAPRGACPVGHSQAIGPGEHARDHRGEEGDADDHRLRHGRSNECDVQGNAQQSRCGVHGPLRVEHAGLLLTAHVTEYAPEERGDQAEHDGDHGIPRSDMANVRTNDSSRGQGHSVCPE
eukprot:CAMPEP_0185202886 /NCGR_PEP_ID=MMETSP1140-20130426/51920_1 /TAXON_ID=298111 /ORGANISM="Pavlova sp., Strain CCMP459" /LENGTH=171 /DNA_ID=CAMNT_0027770363 /DNA_START=404 /DNA_END=920 /DNA_ORIENTATION=-